jgi:hypothetical protein
VTTTQLPRAGAGRRIDRPHPLAALLATILFVAAAAAVAVLTVAGGAGGLSTAAPSPASPEPAAPADDVSDDEVAETPDLPAPADPRSDDAVTPPPAPAPSADEEPVPADDHTPADGLPQADDPATAEEPDPAVEREPVDLVAVQSRLRELGYLVGPADGVAGQQTGAAVMAFQRVNGLGVDGVIGPRTLAALEAPASPELRGGPATRIEVDLTRQLAHVVRDGTRVVTLQVSSGNGEAYPSAGGGTSYARTPVGEYRVERRIVGVRESRLGTLYDPLYFHGGYAIHGSNSVPPYPASHGCVRVTRADAQWLMANISDGTPVHLHGGTHVFTPSG